MAPLEPSTKPRKRSARSLAAEKRFRDYLADVGATPAWSEWPTWNKPCDVICPAGHPCRPRPGNVMNGQGMCITCAKLDPVATEAEFKARLTGLDCAVAYSKWLGNGQAHDVLCPEGHPCTAYPSYIRNGGGVLCRICAEAKFRERVIELRGTPAWGKWEGPHAPHLVICAAGHRVKPCPSSVLRGRGLCLTCAGQDPVAAEAGFRERLGALGITPAYEMWMGATTPHAVICPAGHNACARPSDVQSGKSPQCQECRREEFARQEARYRDRLGELGVAPLWDEWRGVGKPHRLRCKAGHVRSPLPRNVLSGNGPCRICAGLDPATVEADYKWTLAGLGTTPAWTEWRGTDQPHDVICARGHRCSPIPGNVRRGGGPCRFCKGKTWDVFYVVVNDEINEVKFGITSGSPRMRLRDHHAKGYVRLVFLATRIDAQPIEADLIRELRRREYSAVHGREYFALTALSTILEIVYSRGLMNEASREVSGATAQELRGWAYGVSLDPAC